MYQPNEPMRGKYLLRMETKITEEIEQREALKSVPNTGMKQSPANVLKRFQKLRYLFFAGKTDRSVLNGLSNEIIAIQPNFLG